MLSLRLLETSSLYDLAGSHIFLEDLSGVMDFTRPEPTSRFTELQSAPAILFSSSWEEITLFDLVGTPLPLYREFERGDR